MPAPRVPDLRIAGADKEPVEPGLQTAVVSKGGQLSPRDQEGLLDRVLRSADVAQDPIRDGVKPIAELEDKRRERFLVAPLRTIDEVWAHRASFTARLLNMSIERGRMLNLRGPGEGGMVSGGLPAGSTLVDDPQEDQQAVHQSMTAVPAGAVRARSARPASTVPIQIAHIG